MSYTHERIDDCALTTPYQCTGVNPACCSKSCTDLNDNLNNCGSCNKTHQHAVREHALTLPSMSNTVDLVTLSPVSDSSLAAARERVPTFLPRTRTADIVIICAPEIQQLVVQELAET
ncbi:unnamed protein product [Penicillium bialowiezense]